MRPYRLIFYFFKCYLDRVLCHLPIKPDDANLLFQLVNNRYEQHSTIITTNVPLSG
nr:ATP-binding protein [Limosilactobacillus mucosae]